MDSYNEVTKYGLMKLCTERQFSVYMYNGTYGSNLRLIINLVDACSRCVLCNIC